MTTEAQMQTARDDEHSPPCPRCGGETEWARCDRVGCDDGDLGDFNHEMDPLWYPAFSRQRCDWCDGRGGSWWCVESPTVCALGAFERGTENEPREAAR